MNFGDVRLDATQTWLQEHLVALLSHGAVRTLLTGALLLGLLIWVLTTLTSDHGRDR